MGQDGLEDWSELNEKVDTYCQSFFVPDEDPDFVALVRAYRPESEAGDVEHNAKCLETFYSHTGVVMRPSFADSTEGASLLKEFNERAGSIVDNHEPPLPSLPPAKRMRTNGTRKLFYEFICNPLIMINFWQ
jgi:hypothetical protein